MAISGSQCIVGEVAGQEVDWRLACQAVVGQEIKDVDVEWIEGSSWCVPEMLSG